jgi:hypothetical protein
MRNNHTRPRLGKHGVTCRTNISAGTCADDLNACVKSRDADSAACKGFVDNAVCCPALGNK